MSRAFVDEDAASGRGEEVAPLKLPLPPGARNYMTPAGAARQAAELRELQLVRRPALSAKAAAEPSPGPALRALGECDRRIAYLSRMQALLEVVDPAVQRSDRVRFGATVTVRQSPEGERRVRIVGVDEAEPGSGAVSWISPIAKSLMGARVGDTVACELPSGPTRLKVLAIDYR
jgi:transcription elongation factor GreB